MPASFDIVVDGKEGERALALPFTIFKLIVIYTSENTSCSTCSSV